jgi:hypothetical protein
MNIMSVCSRNTAFLRIGIGIRVPALENQGLPDIELLINVTGSFLE